MTKSNEKKQQIINNIKKELFDRYLDNLTIDLYQKIDKIETNAKNFITNTGIFITFILTIIFSGLSVISDKIIGCFFWIILILFIGYILLLCFSIISAIYCINIKIKTSTISVSEEDIIKKINNIKESNHKINEKELENQIIDEIKIYDDKNEMKENKKILLKKEKYYNCAINFFIAALFLLIILSSISFYLIFK